jgi:hypothetical protein
MTVSYCNISKDILINGRKLKLLITKNNREIFL